MTTYLICADDPSPTEDAANVLDGTVRFVADLCVRPRQVDALVDDAETTVVWVVHRSHLQTGAMQATARRLGLDPLALAAVDLDAMGDPHEFPTAVRAARARAASFPGASAEQVKLLPADRTSRRGFLSLGAPTYTGAPQIDHDACVAQNGCRLCATACPADALRWAGGAISYDINTCVACGICVSACPVGAVQNPSVDLASVHAEIEAILGGGPAGIRFRCRAGTAPAEAGWFQVEVPCTGMLTPGWLLTPLLMGAAGVDAVACGTGGCPLGNSDRLEAAMCDTVAMLAAFGLDPGDPLPDATTDPVSAPAATAHAIDVLALIAGPAAADLQAADVGTIAIDAAACTACEMCATVCPTDALTSTSGADGVRISFDPGICVACRQCESVCPEIDHGAIRVHRRFDTSDRAAGRREVRHDPTPLCELCGKPVAPASMLARIESMLGDDTAQTMAVIGRRCLECRGR